jgi:NAD dependent epimerase/dehydratase family enzyme
MKHLLVTGGTGFIGTALCRDLLDRDYRITVLTRDAAQPGLLDRAGLAYVEDLEAVSQPVDGIVNLAGLSLNAGRWTPALKQRFVDSRVATTEGLVAWTRRLPSPPPVLVSASAIGWYGHHGDQRLTT